MNKYKCANCGQDFESKKAFMCGLEYIRGFNEGEFVPDVLIYLCEPCRINIENDHIPVDIG